MDLKEIGCQRLQELQFPEKKNYQPGGKESSRVGKMKTRPLRVLRSHALPSSLLTDASSSSSSSSSGRQYNVASNSGTGHTEYTSAKKLRDAASDGTYEDVLELLRKGANVNKADSKGRTALHFATCKGASDVVKLLIGYGASTNERDCNGSTPLHLACCTNHTSVVTALLKSGTDVNATDARKITPLHLAHSRLRLARESDDKGGDSLSRKKEIYAVVEMLQEYLIVTKSSKGETDELEELAGRLTLSETNEQVDEIQGLMEGFTSLTIKRREEKTS